jgi:arylsulfatase
MQGFDEFFGNLYHLNAEEEPETEDYPKDPAFKKKYGPRGVLHCRSDGKGGQQIEKTGPLTKKRMEPSQIERPGSPSMTSWRSTGRSPGFQSDAVWTTR